MRIKGKSVRAATVCVPAFGAGPPAPIPVRRVGAGRRGGRAGAQVAVLPVDGLEERARGVESMALEEGVVDIFHHDVQAVEVSVLAEHHVTGGGGGSQGRKTTIRWVN